MGLDMFLYERDHKAGFVELDGKTHLICLNGEAKEIGYWRKANAIHKWFVKNVQKGEDDCRAYFVTTEQLEELLNLVNQVLADPTKGKELLPTQSGFFFGSIEYDKEYIRDLEDTKKIIEKALQANGGIYYRSSW